jgi:hypothetical protein
MIDILMQDMLLQYYSRCAVGIYDSVLLEKERVFKS